MADLDPNRGRETFVGRSREVAEIRAGIDGAIAGRGSFFTLAGEPGVGKSRLAQEAASYARAHGARVVWGRCWEHGGAPAYWPWAQVLRGLSRGIDLAQLSNWMGSSASEIAQIAPEVGNQIGGVAELPSASLGQPDAARFRLFDSLNAFIGKAAEVQPLLIVLDDLHAADPASLRILVAFSRQLRGMCATAIATYRALEVKQQPEHAALIAQAEREGVAFPLLGLDESNIATFIEAAWGVSANASLVRRLHDLTEGNPFFLNAVLRQMAAEGQLANGASSVPARLTLPRGVIEFIKGLIQPLPEDARSVLDIASVVGRDFNLNRLEAASGLPREAVTDLLDQAESLELVHEVRGVAGRYSFRHALIREALYDALPSARRRRLHRVVAEAIRGLGETREPYAEIAYHYCQSASPGDADAAIEYSRRAARTAEKSLAYEEAAHHLGNAIEALALKRGGDDPFLAELLCDLGEAQVKTGDLAEARKICHRAADIARRVKRPDLFARAVLAPGRYLGLSGVTDHGFVQLLNEARAMLDDSCSPLLVQVLARLGIELYWSERQQAVVLCQQAADMARGVNDPHTLIVALWGRWLSLRNPDSLEQRLADTSEMITVAENAGERDFALEARFFRVADLLEAGNIVGADVEHREYLTAETELRDRFGRGLLLEGMRALMDGRLDDSETLAKQAFAAGQQSGRPLTPNSFLIQHGMTLWERGRFGELESTLRGFIAQYPLIVFARCALQLILLQKGQPDDARVEFERLAEDEFRFVQRDWNWLPSMFVLADVCADLGNTQRAEVLYQLLAPYASRNAMLGNVYTYGSVAYALGRLAAVLGRSDDAEAHFDAALAANRRIRAAVWLAHTQCELARVLLARNAAGDYARVQELIASARQTAEALDLVRLRRKLELFAGHRDEPRKAAAVRSPSLVEGVAAAEASSPLELRAVAQKRPVRMERRLSAILATDVVGYSRLMHNDEETTHARLMALLADAVEPAIAEHGGRVVKNTGDGFLAEFPSAVQAVRAAVQFQTRIKKLTVAEMEDRRIAFRVGINIGDVIIEPHDIFGDGVNIAARLEGIAEPGGICISSSAYEQVIGKVAIEFIDLGEQSLKNIARPVRTYAVVLKESG
jgi:eukaryotic-like serine/threonine-protein kinase